jgi:ketosteroid isomerase-like protein
VQVSPSADAAIATYILRVTTRSVKGTVATEDNQETDVLFKRGGAWTIVHVNYAPAKKAGAQ